MANLKKKIEKNVVAMTATELRLTVQVAQRELTNRRNDWVRDTYERFCKQENSDMARAAQFHHPNNYWATDRIVVTCFKDKNRSKTSVGVARLSPGDSFDYCTGVAIAFARAMGEEVPDLF